MRCLIAEDVEFAREMMSFFLADYAEIDSVDNGETAVELFSAALEEGRPYNFVCLDILMPKMDGQEALKRMRQIEALHEPLAQEKSVIVMTTAMNSLEDMQEALWRGDCTDYLVKPVMFADLVAVMTKYGLITKQETV